MLQSSFGVGNVGRLVSEEEVTEQLLKCFSVRMQSPEVKQTDIKTVADVYCAVIVKVFQDLFKHCAQKRCWTESGTELNLVSMWKDPARLLFNLTWPHRSLCSWITLLRNFGGSQSLSAYYIKRFGQVHKRYILFFILLPAFLLELSKDKHHVCGAPGFLVDGLQRCWVPICLGAYTYILYIRFFCWLVG